MTRGEIPIDLVVCHHCDNPVCCNPDHLFLGTTSDNAVDAANKGRLHDARGANNGAAKLIDRDIAIIRSLYASGAMNSSQLAEAFGVSRPTITYILQRKTWKHVA